MKTIKELKINYYRATKNIQKATLIITHGLAEYSKSYINLATFLQEEGFDVITYDIRGHGKREGKRGYVESYADFLVDLDILVKYAYQNTQKVFLFGHSMGGIITNLYTSLNNNVDGVIITASPTKILPILQPMRILPTFLTKKIKLKTNFADPFLVHNYNYVVDEYDIHYFYLHLIVQIMIKGMKKLQQNFINYNTPILMIYSKEDKRVSIKMGEYLYSHIGSDDKTLLIYNDSYHNIHLDIEYDNLKKDVIDWLKNRV